MSKLTILAHKNTLAGTRDGGRGPEYAPPAPGHPLTFRSARDLDAFVRALPTHELERLMESAR